MRKDGGLAFPVPPDGLTGNDGMSLRDYFAGQSIIAAYHEAPTLREYELNALFGKERAGMKREEIAAALAYRIADAMLIRRESLR